MTDKPYCNFFWGSHGCDRRPGHEGFHICGADMDPCSQHDGGTRVRFWNAVTGAYGEWEPYGPLFSND